MKKYILSALAIASALFAGCNMSELQTSVPQTGTVKVSASLDVTKVALNGSKLVWEAGDTIGVWTGAEFTPFTVDAATVGQGAGTFTGTLPEGGAVDANSYAVFPYREGDTMEGTVYKSDLTDRNTKYALAAKPDAALNGSSVANYKFGQLTAAVKFTVKNIPVDAKYIFFESTKQLFVNEANADLSAEYPKFDVTATGDWYFYALPEHDSVIKSLDIVVPIVTGEFADPLFRFTLFSADNWDSEFPKDPYNHKGYLNTGGFINRSDVYVLPDVNFGSDEIELASETMTIDGDFSDWNSENVATLELQEGAALKALKTVKYAADASYLYVYMHLENIKANNNAGDDNVMMDFYIDCDGDPATGGVRSDSFNHGINWYFETFFGDPNQGGFGKWDNGQYEYTGADGGGVFSSLFQHTDPTVVVREGVYDEATDGMTLEARLDREFFKLVNTKIGLGMIVMEGSSDGWPAMGKLPQNEDNSLLVFNIPAFAAPAEPVEIALTADMISTNAPMEYVNACGGGDVWSIYEPYGLTDAADWVLSLAEADEKMSSVVPIAEAREAALGLATNMWDADAATAFMTNFDIWAWGGGWTTRSGSAKTGHYVQVTFAEPVNGVKMYLQNGPYYPFGDAGFNVAVSTDGESFANTADSPYANAGAGSEITIDEIKADGAIKAIRILNNGDVDWTNNGPVICISELKLWGLQ